MEEPQTSQSKHLLLGTISFTFCFAAWGMISAFAPHFRQQFHLTATQTAFLVAVPVLLGALARIPIGMLADRFGGRVVFTALMFFVALPVALVPAATRYQNLLIVAFLLGMAGSSFAVGVGYVSRWFSMESQGSALGVYGLGNIGQSAAVFHPRSVHQTFCPTRIPDINRRVQQVLPKFAKRQLALHADQLGTAIPFRFPAFPPQHRHAMQRLH